MQDVSRGHAVYNFRAFCPAGVLGDEFAGDRRCGQPLIPENKGNFRHWRGLANEGAGGLHARAFAAIHVERQTDDESSNSMIARKLDHPGHIRREFRPSDRFERRGQPSLDVGQGKTDGFCSQIDSHQPRLSGQAEAEVFEGQDGNKVFFHRAFHLRLEAG